MCSGQVMVNFVAGCTCVNCKPTDIYSSFSILTTTFYITTAEAYSYKNSCQWLRHMYRLCSNLQKSAVKLTKYVQKTVCMPVTFLAQSSLKDANSSLKDFSASAKWEDFFDAASRSAWINPCCIPAVETAHMICRKYNQNSKAEVAKIFSKVVSALLLKKGDACIVAWTTGSRNNRVNVNGKHFIAHFWHFANFAKNCRTKTQGSWQLVSRIQSASKQMSCFPRKENGMCTKNSTYMWVAGASKNKSDLVGWSPLWLTAAVWSCTRLPFGFIVRNNINVTTYIFDSCRGWRNVTTISKCNIPHVWCLIHCALFTYLRLQKIARAFRQSFFETFTLGNCRESSNSLTFRADTKPPGNRKKLRKYFSPIGIRLWATY